MSSEVSSSLAMIPPSLLVRDTALAGLLLSGGALFWGPEVAMVVGIGALAAFANLVALVFAARGAVSGGPSGMLLPMKLLLAIGLVTFLVGIFPPVPVLVGFGAGPLGIVLCGVEGLRFLTPTETP